MLMMSSPMPVTTPRRDFRRGLPPGPRSLPIVQALNLWLRPTAFLAECPRQHGDAFTLRVPGLPPEVHFSHPDAIREIFTADADDLRAGEANVVIEPVLGYHSLLLLDGPRHLRERCLLLPPFHGERVPAYG